MATDQHGNQVAHKVKVTSWVAVFILVVGFVLIGVATIIPGWTGSATLAWTLGGLGAGLFLVGGVVGMVGGIMDEVH